MSGIPVKRKTMVVGGKNRRALGDIGNVATVRGGGEGINTKKISRPVTRTFGSQLLADAQALRKKTESNAPFDVTGGRVTSKPAANVASSKPAKRPAPARNPASGLPVAPHPVQKKTVPKTIPKPVVDVVRGSKEEKAMKLKLPQGKAESSKPKPKTVVEVIRGIKEDKAMKLKLPHEKAESSSTMKITQTLTSLLSARSRAVCELDEKGKEKTIINVDTQELALVEYSEQLYKYYVQFENKHRAHDYISSQPEINAKMRAILVDWLIEVHHRFELTMETFYLTVNIIDRFLALTLIPKNQLQLVGVAATLIASKYEEIWAPQVNDLVCISDRAYSHQEILKMEKRILEKLNWTLTVPTPYVFLVRFIKASSSSSGPVPDNNMENLSYCLAEMGMTNYTGVTYCPSMIAASAVFVARCALGKKPRWNETLKFHTRYKSENELMDLARLLVKFHSRVADYKSIFRKYSRIDKGSVAFIPPAKFLLGGGSS